MRQLQMSQSTLVSTRPGGQRCVLKPLFHFSFFLQLFHFFTLFIAPSSTSLLPPRPSSLLVPPSSSSLLPPRPSFFLVQHCESFRIRKWPFFIDLDESITDRRTNGPTNGRTDKASYRYARTHLKRQRQSEPTGKKRDTRSEFQNQHSTHRVRRNMTIKRPPVRLPLFRMGSYMYQEGQIHTVPQIMHFATRIGD